MNSQATPRLWQTQILRSLALVRLLNGADGAEVAAEVVVPTAIQQRDEPLRRKTRQGMLITIESGATIRKWREWVLLLPETSVVIPKYISDHTL
jgi:hypothetical protein